MTERPQHPSSSEESDSQEVEAFASAHWEFLAEIPFKDSKINHFARAVLDGRLAGTSEEIQLHLGLRHRDEIIVQMYKLTTGIRGRLNSRFRPQISELAEGVQHFVQGSDVFNPSLDDLYENFTASWGGDDRWVDRLDDSHNGSNSSYTLTWNSKKQSWRLVSLLETREARLDGYDLTKNDPDWGEPVYKYSYKEKRDVSTWRGGSESSDPIADNIIYLNLPITREQIPQPSSRTLQQLKELSRLVVSEEELIRRSIHQGASSSISGWEKPIPQAA